MNMTALDEMMTIEQIRRRVAELGEWFHNLDLGGVKTAPDHFLGDYPAVKWQRFSAAIPDASSPSITAKPTSSKLALRRK
jgi:tRNA (mo5U34)-methyltransferase